MAKKNISAKELQEIIDRANAAANRNIELLKQEKDQMNSIFDTRRKIALEEEIINQERIKQQNIIEILNKYESDGLKIHGNKLKSLEKERKESLNITRESEKRLKITKATLAILNESISVTAKGVSSMSGFLMESDAAIKSVALELGLSGERAAILRNSFEDSAVFAAGLGANMKDVAQMTSIYAEETGRARMHNKENLEAITEIAKGTALGVEGAAQLAAQYEMFGFNAKDTAQEVQNIVDTTERMGVNTGKVLKTVSKNFKTLQKFTFRGGSQGIADMAMYATKFKVNMDEVINSLEKGRALDSVIEMSAQLQVLGGQFGNLADPMAMLFESRNDPEAYTKRINEMTKGMVTMNKTAKGFELQIASPMAQDQLAAAAKALGMTTDELTQQAFRMREIQQTRSQMFSKGFTKDEKEIVEGLAKFDKNTGRMMVEVGGVATDVSQLTSKQVQALKQEQSTLEERAKASQSFDKAFENTVMQLKSTLLPLLNNINSVLETIRPPVEKLIKFFDESNSWVKGGMLVAGALLFSATKLGIAFAKAKVLDAVGVGGKGGVGSVLSKSAVGGTSPKSVGGAVAKGAGGSGMLKGGLGIGAAGVGIGAGVGAAAVGISELADSMSKLTPEQAETLENIAMTLAIAFPAAAIGIAAVAAVAAPAAIPLLALGAAFLGIGAGVGIAAAGIGYMAEGLSTLDGVDLSGIGGGLLSIGAASLMFANPASLVGLGAMTASMMTIASSADNLERVGNAFYNIGTVLKGNSSQLKEVRDIIKDISAAEVSSDSAIAQLSQMLSKPLKVEFSEKEVGFVANIDLTMGDSNFITKISKKIPARIVDLQQAKS